MARTAPRPQVIDDESLGLGADGKDASRAPKRGETKLSARTAKGVADGEGADGADGDGVALGGSALTESELAAQKMVKAAVEDYSSASDDDDLVTTSAASGRAS